MRQFLFLVIFLIATTTSYAQVDKTNSNSLLNDLMATETEQPALLPNHMIFTQGILWGKKGLMRNFDRFELTPEKRQQELKVRRTMLVTHQVLGFVTLGGMIAQGFVGAGLYNGNQKLKGAHEALAAGVNFGYFTTASLSLFAPPKMVDERKGFSSIKLHKALAIIHFTAMVATNILAGQLNSNPDLRPYHRAAAYTAFGAFAVSMIVIKF
jgi:hypothetical protein